MILFHRERDMIANSNEKKETLGQESMRLENQTLEIPNKQTQTVL